MFSVFQGLSVLLIFSSGIILCVQDFSSRSVSIIQLLVFVIGCSIYGIVCKSYAIVLPIIFIAIHILCFLITKKKAFGIADHIAILAVACLVKTEQIPIFLLLSGINGVTISIFYKRTIPFIPAILFSTALVKLLDLADLYIH